MPGRGQRNRTLERFKARNLAEARGKRRTGSTHVLAAVRLLEPVGETLRAATDDLATVAPGWLRGVAPQAWFEACARRVEDYRVVRRLR